MSVRRALLPLGVAACALAPGQAAAAAPQGLSISSKPSLYPTFRKGTPDYVVRCDADKRVRISVSAPSGTEVAVGDRAPRSGSFSARVRLAPGGAVGLRFITGADTKSHLVRCLPSDFPAWKAKLYGRPQAAWYVLAPYDNQIAPRYVAVFDSHGVPVWWMRRSPPPFDATLLPNGNLVWTHLVIRSPYSDYFEEHGLDGRLVRTYSTVGTRTNLHEFQALPNGNVLLLAYPPRDGVDLSPWGGPKRATVLDGEIQEVDPQGNLVWSWSTRGHVATGETRRWFPWLLFQVKPIRLDDSRSAYDIVHLNSIEPVGDKLVISARFDDAVYEIDKATGAVVWKLGGTNTSRSLKILGDPLGSKELGAQHDARVLDGGRIVTVYDNGTLRRSGSSPHRPPRVLAFRIDLNAWTARLVREIRFGPAQASVCCGSARKLPGGNWVVSWGHTPWVTELTRSGRRVLTIQFDDNEMGSYRADPVLPGRLSRADLQRGMDAMAAP